MIWLKAFHIIFVICWFAGIFYLPRLFVNHAMSEEPAVQQRLALMERKLYRFTTGLAVIAIVLGLLLTFANFGYFMAQGWFHTKLALVLLLIAYHLYCGRLVAMFAAGHNTRGHVFYRWFNEIPVLMLVGIVIMVVVRPF
jgi:protoporphyrinogen IX oxidase